MILCHDRISTEVACKNFKNVLKPDFHESTYLEARLIVKESYNSVMTQTNDDDLLLGKVIFFSYAGFLT